MRRVWIAGGLRCESINLVEHHSSFGGDSNITNPIINVLNDKGCYRQRINNVQSCLIDFCEDNVSILAFLSIEEWQK